jgi:hypothetical protein
MYKRHVVVINLGRSSTWEFKKEGRFRASSRREARFPSSRVISLFLVGWSKKGQSRTVNNSAAFFSRGPSQKDLLTRSFLRHFRGNRLSAKTRVDRDHQQKINLVKKRLINRSSEFVKQS